MKTQPRITLASTSRYRRALLERLGLRLETAAPDADETRLADEAPSALAARLARLKASSALKTVTGGVVIGSDQVAALGDTVLGKPGSRDRAIAQLTAQSGQAVDFYTAVCVIDAESGERLEHLDITRVQFRALEAAEIERYVDAEQPFDCAGSFKSEGLGITLFESIRNDDPSALVGLPLIATCRLLREFGVKIP